ncbi:choice-of-anchor Q domain-containing protein [Desulfonatronovibrio magnus]|uniref:choice-of-anchor Q domain-containing protein n=1 Tax=Desulfonatronovibrio magnus TaxID=698827 RepID=UPI0005EB638C|nr:choice-of-anchor Q domain-containing protein [Desulfonatronovibrio magnus]
MPGIHRTSIIFSALIIILLTIPAYAGVLHVTSSGTGNGESWDNAFLEPLEENKGFTRTHAIPSSSPAYAIPQAAGSKSWNNAPDYDQRGMPRTVEGYRAMGSYEESDLTVLGAPAFIHIPRSSDSGDYIIEWGSSTTGGVTFVLQEAVNDSFTEGLETVYRGPDMSFSIKD